MHEELKTIIMIGCLLVFIFGIFFAIVFSAPKIVELIRELFLSFKSG